MTIRQWLQEDLQKRRCAIVINKTLRQLSKTVEKKVVEDFYQELLNLNFSDEAENYVAANLAGAKARGIPLQNTIDADGKIVSGYNHELASILLVNNLQTLIREKYATI